MPPRIRTRATKAQKENIDTENKAKTTKTNTKAPRKALADKTNSASDSSDEVSKAPKKVPIKASKDEIKRSYEIKNDERPRRNRRLPTRYVENSVLNNLSQNSKNSAIVLEDSIGSKPINVSKKDTPVKNKEPEVSPFKTPGKADSSLVISRPRRICRLPSRFDDHSLSPSRYIPIQPDNASTPIQQSKSKPPPANNADQDKKAKKSPLKPQQLTIEKKVDKEIKATKPPQSAQPSTKTVQKKIDKNLSSNKNTSDSNNNAKGRSTRAKKAAPKVSPRKISPKLNSIKRYLTKSASPILTPIKKVSPEATTGKRVIDKNTSFKVLGDTKKSQKSDNNDLDIYEFTFDPAEEPKLQKNKRKKPTVKKSAKVTKPKAVVTYKSTYDKNISKALLALKNAVKSSKPTSVKLPQIQEAIHEVPETDEQNLVAANNISTGCKTNQMSAMNDTGKASVHECNYPSIRVEDIAADIEPSIDHHDDLNYSPVNSPRPASPNPLVPRESPKPAHNNDPINLQEELSFFDDVPVASSSMNVSVRHPTASPWRVEFGSLPIRWHSNTYVKPNMTPAVESSFICSEDSNKKRHVYTNMVPETNNSLPEIVNDTPNLKQTSIISFIREVAERKLEKKRGRSVSPTKALAILNKTDVEINPAPKKNHTDTNNDPLPIVNTSEELSSNNDASDNKENSKEKRKTRKRKNDENVCEKPAKSPRKQKDKDCTYFGFDDSENQDSENVSPIKAKTNVRGRSLRHRSRAVLQEINGPTRAALPIAAKSKLAPSSEVINKVFEELKSAAVAPEFPDKNVEQNVTNIEESYSDDDAESVHLFEDIEVVHHLKPTRKSYGKAKKVTFQQHSTSDGESHPAIACRNNSSYEDDLGDLTFEVPNVKEKKKSKKKPKKLMSKKEEKEAEEWAAGFNSMCEEIEDFQLVVE